jgi:preprotein translocase subunit SecF
MKDLRKEYDKHYKKLLIIPAALLLFSLVFLIIFYFQTGDIISKDISLTGGTAITLFSETAPATLENLLESKSLTNFEINSLSDNTGVQTKIVITTTEENSNQLIQILEDYLGEKLTQENSSIEKTSSTLSKDFYQQLIIAVVLAFFWMSAVVFLIFSKGKKRKFWVILLNILLGFLLGHYFLAGFPIWMLIILILLGAGLIYTYIKVSIPSFAVMLSAFADIVMTLAFVNLLGMKVSTAGLVAFLMLIGYSVDTDILLTTRIIKDKKHSVNRELFGAFKTGTMMTLTSMVAIATALIVVFSFGTVLNQIFSILLIGLCFDLINTWLTNATMLKWFVEVNNEN